jgi:nitrobindin-like protein
VELTLAHPLGLVEVAEGTLDASPTGGTIHVASTTMAATATGDQVTALDRRIEVTGETLRYELLMQMREVPMARHLVAELKRR